MSRSARNTDCTPLAIIQEEVFQLRQRQKLAEAAQINARPGPPPDMAQFAAVYKPDSTNQSPPTQQFQQQLTQQQQQSTQQQVQQPVHPTKKKTSKSAVVVSSEFYPEDFKPSPIQTRRLRNETLVKYQLFVVITIIVFLCLYIYPVTQKTPNDRRMSALKTLTISIIVSLICTWMIVGLFTKVDP